MTKTIISIALFSMAGLLTLWAVVYWSDLVIRNLRVRHDGVLNWSPFMLPDFVAINGFWTTPTALLLGAFGVALLCCSVAFHLQYLRRHELGERYYRENGKLEEVLQHGGASNPHSPSALGAGGR